MNFKTLGLVFCLVLSGMFLSGSLRAQDHPNYMHALSNLRTARWMLDHRPGNWKQSRDEEAAEREINDAIREIHEATIDDHRGMDEHEKWAEHNDRGGRLRDAKEFLNRARQNMERAEDFKGLKGRILRHISESQRFVDMAMNAR